MGDGAGPPDGDLVRLARDGDPVAFRLLVERYQPMVRARARDLGADPADVDDVAQESFLQAFLALERLRDPDRFASWLAGIVLNVWRGLVRRAPVTLLPDWPEPLHPAASDGLPSADDLDRADALRAAMAGLPAGQRRAIALRYYADLPAGQIAGAAGTARVSLHKARRRLRAYLTEHRPDLVPAVSRRPQMTAVRIARAERLPRPRRPAARGVVLADDAGGRELPVWLAGFDGNRLIRLLEHRGEEAAAPQASTADELIGRLLRAIRVTVTGVDIDELGPEVTAARVGLAGPSVPAGAAVPAGARQVTARLADGLALAITTGAPVRVADGLMDRLAVPAGALPVGRPGDRGPAPGARGESVPPRPRRVPPVRPRYEPRNVDFADGLDGWVFGGSFTEHASESHWHDYACAAAGGTAVISSEVPEPAGFAFLRQVVFADDYRGGTAVFRGEFRVQADGPGRAGLFLRVREGWGRAIRGPLTDRTAFADPGNSTTQITGAREWTRHDVAAPIPGDCDVIGFGIFLYGRGRIEMRDPQVIRRA